MDESRRVGEEARKVHRDRLLTGFIGTYLSGANILDIGYKGYLEDVVPIVPQAIGIELDYPGYDGRTLPFAEGSQDAVFASHCLEHIPDFGQALREWTRVLRIGGFLVIMVPHQFLYEKRAALPSRYNADHQRFYTPASLIADIEATLLPNSYRLRHLADNDRHFDYTIPPDRHSGGCYEIELVIEKIAAPDWSIVTREPAERIMQSDFDAVRMAPDASNVRRRDGGIPKVSLTAASPWDVALYEFGQTEFTHRRRILVLQLGHLGDFIIGLPALRQLREAFPDDEIHLVTGSWNRAVAEASGLPDKVATYDYFPEVARGWSGQPHADQDDFIRAAPGCFDIALDLRVDEDTRHLLDCVDAGMRCGIGATARFPNLDIVLPIDYARRPTDNLDRSLNILLGPERFHSRMPVQTPFEHRTSFSESGMHVIYGPYLQLPLGRFRATFGLRISGLPAFRNRARVTLDVVQGGSVVLAEHGFAAADFAESPGQSVHLDFTNVDDHKTCEFRVYIAGRPLRTTLVFTGVRLDQLEAPATPRLRPADLHIGEQLSLLVQLVADRTRQLYAGDTDSAEANAARARTQQEQWPEGKYRVAIAPVSNSDLRDWPAEHYAVLARLLVERLDCSVQLIGSRQQSGMLGHIVQASGVGHRVVNLAGRTAWADLPAALGSSDLVICNNSGIAHLAASLGLRTLAIYSASHQPQEWGPRGARSKALMAVVPCSPCGYDRLAECPYDHACMQGLSPDVVFDQAATWLNA